MKITSVEPQKKEGRYNIFVDEGFWCGVSENTLAKFGLYPKREVDEDYLNEVFEFEIFNKLYDGSLRKIGRRPHSQREIERYISDKLYKNKKKWFKNTKYEDNYKEISSRLQLDVISKLEKEGLLNDEEFVKWWIESRSRSRPRGWIALKSELYSKGVDEKTIKKYELGDSKERELAKKYYRKITKSKNLSREKIISRMQSRGFSWDIISSLLEEDEVEST